MNTTLLLCDEDYGEFGIMNTIEWDKEPEDVVCSFLDDIPMEEFEGLCRISKYVSGLVSRYYK